MKQDYFTRDKGKFIEHKKVGSEVRLSPAGKYNKALYEKALEKKKSGGKSKGTKVYGSPDVKGVGAGY